MWSAPQRQVQSTSEHSFMTSQISVFLCSWCSFTSSSRAIHLMWLLTQHECVYKLLMRTETHLHNITGFNFFNAFWSGHCSHSIDTFTVTNNLIILIYYTIYTHTHTLAQIWPWKDAAKSSSQCFRSWSIWWVISFQYYLYYWMISWRKSSCWYF